MKTSDPLSELFDPANPIFSEDGARRLLALSTDEEILERMDALAEKCNEATLTPEEHREYENWVRESTFISVLQAQARLYLARLSPA
ncbi:hypothetical protein [Prosthecobacter fusiformis]|nr:hypothetical protein [Prosthecobacter fusiformis]